MATHLGCQECAQRIPRQELVRGRGRLPDRAFTWGSSEPDDGGTLDTWKKCTSKNKVHASLSHLQHSKLLILCHLPLFEA